MAAITYIKTGQISYNLNNGSGQPSSPTSNSSSSFSPNDTVNVKISNSTPTRTNYTFTNWQDSNGTTYNPGDIITFSFNDQTNWQIIDDYTRSATSYVTLKAIWTYNGTVTTKQMYIKVDGQWKEAIPYIKVNGQWKIATPYIKSGTKWI